MNSKKTRETFILLPPRTSKYFYGSWKKKLYMMKYFYTSISKNRKKWVQIKWYNIEADLVLGFPIPIWVTAIFPSIKDITLEKTYIETVFPDHTLHSLVCENYIDIEKNFWHIKTELKVLKPLRGTRGRGIFIQEYIPQKEELPELYYPYILQEFFDTSSGWESYPGYHDFRVVILNGKIIGQFLRQPKKGSYISNTHKRWAFYDMSIEPLPDDVSKIVTQIDSISWKRVSCTIL